MCTQFTNAKIIQNVSHFNFRFNVKVLLSLCQQSEKRPLAGIVVIGNGQSARAVALSGSSMQLPVLWARGGVANLHYREVCTILNIFLLL